jgi:Glycoside-hydrolase family GH114/Integrase core domain
VGAYDIDGWGNDAAEVAALHARGIKVVCYMDAGTYEPERPDSASFPPALKGSAVEGLAETWRRHYNEVRPRSSLGYLTPTEFRAKHVTTNNQIGAAAF